MLSGRVPLLHATKGFRILSIFHASLEHPADRSFACLPFLNFSTRSRSTTSTSQLDFQNSREAYGSWSSSELIRAWTVFRACTFPLFVKNADRLLSISRQILGDHATFFFVRQTFFKHFCAGEDEKELWLTMKKLHSRGINGILDYAAEDDVGSKNGQQGHAAAAPHNAAADNVNVVARQYDYQSEQQCDHHVEHFLTSIRAAAKMPDQGITAVKMTALGNPILMERVSTAIRAVRSLFVHFDRDGNGIIDRTEFKRGYKALFPDAECDEKERIFEWLDVQGTDAVDYVAWVQRLSLEKMPDYAARILRNPKLSGDVSHVGATAEDIMLTDEEVGLVQAMRGRLCKLAQVAADQGVKLMVDAEHTYFQPAIDHLTLELARQYNKASSGAIVFNTYQAYLRDSLPRLVDDLERARRQGYVLGVKLVRGAYLNLERQRAQEMGYASPVWDELHQTHSNYNTCLKMLMEEVKQGHAELMLGSHNQESVELAVREMARLELDPPSSPVFFGQLFGMSDNLTQVLGSAGYRALKCVPYGKVQQVIPYLLRRAAENSSVMEGSKHDLRLIGDELKRRMMRFGLPASTAISRPKAEHEDRASAVHSKH